jgi:hypothetical protein
MRRRFLTLKARVSQFGRNKGNTRQGSDARQDWQSPLDNARTVLELLSNLGSGAINVPGLQAASRVGIQIIDIVKVGELYIPANAVVIDESLLENQK